MNYRYVIFADAVVSVLFVIGSPCPAQLVIPQIGGGQTGMLSAPMKHADVSFDGVAVSVAVDGSVDNPVLRSLEDGFEFDPEQPWATLSEKAYNFQYGWNPGGFISLPANAWIWIEQLHASPELEVYQRPPAFPSYDRIFESDGSIWKWPGSMTHNVYAVAQPQRDEFEATYRIYIGDEDTGTELLEADNTPTYGSDTVTFHFEVNLVGDFDGSGILDPPDMDILSAEVRSGEYAVEFDLVQDDLLNELDRKLWIEELVGTVWGDADLNGRVEFKDFLRLSSGFGSETGWADGDFDGNGEVGFADFLALSKNFGKSASRTTQVPEPSSHGVLLLSLFAVFSARRWGQRAGLTLAARPSKRARSRFCPSVFSYRPPTSNPSSSASSAVFVR